MGTHSSVKNTKIMNGLVGILENNYRWLRYKWLEDNMHNVYFIWLVLAFLSLCYICDSWSASQDYNKDEKEMLMQHLKDGKISLTEYHEKIQAYENRQNNYDYKPSEKPSAPLQQIDPKKVAWKIKDQGKQKLN